MPKSKPLLSGNINLLSFISSISRTGNYKLKIRAAAKRHILKVNGHWPCVQANKHFTLRMKRNPNWPSKPFIYEWHLYGRRPRTKMTAELVPGFERYEWNPNGF